VRYRIFDRRLDSELALPELPPGSGPPDLQVYLDTPPDFDPDAFTLAFEWRHPGQPVICQVSRRCEDYLFTYPGLVDFHLTLDGRIHCLAGEDCGEDLLRHLLLNQAIPRLLAEQGALVLHASAVVGPDGRALAFTGRSGTGKSTLAAFLRDAGWRVLADDCILLEVDSGQVRAIGAYPGLRLWPGAGTPRSFRPVHEGTPKRHVAWPETNRGPEAPLAGLYLLDGPGALGDKARVEPLRGAAAMMGVLRETFALDPSRPEASERAFTGLGTVLEAGLPVGRLVVPPGLERLEEVLGVLEGAARLAPAESR